MSGLCGSGGSRGAAKKACCGMTTETQIIGASSQRCAGARRLPREHGYGVPAASLLGHQEAGGNLAAALDSDKEVRGQHESIRTGRCRYVVTGGLGSKCAFSFGFSIVSEFCTDQENFRWSSRSLKGVIVNDGENRDASCIDAQAARPRGVGPRSDGAKLRSATHSSARETSGIQVGL